MVVLTATHLTSNGLQRPTSTDMRVKFLSGHGVMFATMDNVLLTAMVTVMMTVLAGPSRGTA